jgi:hypothetical protein
MSERQSKSPNIDAVLAVLGHASELCRGLDLPDDAATFDGFIARYQLSPPTYETLRDEVYHAINGITGLRIISKLKDDYSEYNRLQRAFSDVAFPGHREEYERIKQRKIERKLERKRKGRKAVMESDKSWQLEGESDLHVVTIPARPKAGVAATVRLTHSNSDFPFDELEFFVRIGDPDEPTEQDDLDTADDWVPARLVEELVFVDDQEILRSEARKPFKGITPWWGTYDAKLTFPRGRHSIEIKIVSQRPELHVSAVLSDWQVEVR